MGKIVHSFLLLFQGIAIDILFLLAWFIPSEAAWDAATPNVPKPSKPAAPLADEEGDELEGFGEDDVDGIFEDFFDNDAVFGVEFTDWDGEECELEPSKVLPKLPYAADMPYNAISTK